MVVVIVFLLWIIPEKKMKNIQKKSNIHNFKNNFMKINLYKALPILLISADLLIYVIDSEISSSFSHCYRINNTTDKWF
jgi:hypothetical protein